MNKFAENMKLYGTVIMIIVAIMSGAYAVGKEKLDQHIKDTVATEVQPIKVTQENIMTLLKIMATEKEMEKFEQEKSTDNALKGKK